MKDIIKMALKSLYDNKLRTFLSTLGIIIGVATISLVIAIGLGAQKDIEEQFKTLSVTAIVVMPVNTAGSISKSSIEDIEYIKKIETVESATAFVNGKLQASSSTESMQVGILGVVPDIFEISNLEKLSGDYISEINVEKREKVAVLGSSIVDDLFAGDRDIIGKTINIGRKKVKIIGILKKSGGSIGPVSYDDSVFLPYSTAESILGKSGTTRLIVLSRDINSIDLAMSDLSRVLRESHRLKDSQTDDFRLRDQGSKVISAQESARTMNLLLTLVAIIVLVVSGIGIMNVMFAGVAERTREIGILKSIGAKRSDILNQFLVESIVLSVLGGIIGVILGKLLIPIINDYADMTTIRSNFGMFLAFCFSVVVGIFFGYYPAYKASKLDPVDALRS